MELDISILSASELRDLRANIDKTIELREKEELAQLRAEIIDIVTSRGYTLQQIMDFKTNSAQSPAFTRGKHYADPANPKQVWKCTGSRPLWVRNLLANGVTLIEVDHPDA